MEKILVTGGTGMVGKCLQKICKKKNLDNYIFVGSKDADLTDYNQTKMLMEKYLPTTVIHLASVVGGLFFNINNNSKMLDINTRINLNTIKCCAEYNIQKVIVVLSTCAFPYTIDTFPMVEEDIHKGPVHPTNEGYGESKRIAEILTRMYGSSSNTKFISLFPCNLYGENDNFSDTGHVLSGLISKCHNAKIENRDLLVFGSGKPLRQFLFTDDFANILVNIVNNFDSINEQKLIICNDNDEISINDLARMVSKTVCFDGNIINDLSKSDGIYRKTVSNNKFKNIFPDFKFTTLEQGITHTYKWFQENTLLKITCDIGIGLSGGLGNQLFSIATTLALSYKYNMYPFFRYYNSNHYRYNNDHTNTIFKNLVFLNDENVKDYDIYYDNNDVFDIVDKPHNNIILNGYFQTAKNFDKYKDRIVNSLYISDEDNKIINDNINKFKTDGKKLLGIHFRRQDYHNLGWVLPITYYQEALKYFNDYNVIMFTDDPEYCTNYFPMYSICNTGIDSVDMLILSKMDACIMSNSTFCWWGIYIGNIDTVIAPFPWFPNSEYNKNIYNEKWRLISYL